MKLGRFVLRGLLAGTMAMLGCGDDDGNGGNGGTSGTGGSAGTGGAAGAGGTGGSAGTGGSSGGNVMPGFYFGRVGDPFSGEGWAVCFYVAPSEDRMMVISACDFAVSDEMAHAFEILSVQSSCRFNISYGDVAEADFGQITIDPQGRFGKTFEPDPGTSGTLTFEGTLDGPFASGTAQRDPTNGATGTFCETAWTADLGVLLP